MTIPQMVIRAIIAAAAIAILFIALHFFKIPIPPFVMPIIWVLVIATICVFAIMYLMRLPKG